MRRALWMLLLTVLTASPAVAQLNENCVVSILNRTAQVRPDGSWRIDNVPANFGLVRARATCVENGVTRSGQSEYFNVQANTVNGFDAEIVLGAVDPIPESVAVTAPTAVLTPGQPTVQLTVTARFPNGSTANVTAASAGTNYTISNPAVASVGPDGLVTAIASGTVLVSASKDGALGLFQVAVRLSGDGDGDGIPDDLELANGLDPNDPADALADFDADGLTNLQELVEFGTDLRDGDSDDDTILDGEEVTAGADGFVTNALLADTDGDGIRDALEVETDTDPTDPASFDLARALQALEITPAAFTLTVNVVVGEASRQLTVTGRLRDGTAIDLTSTQRGTNYTSSSLAICNFGAPAGRVFAGADGSCTITATNSGFSAQALGTVRTFTPRALGFVNIPGFANNVDLAGNRAYVAAGATGLQVVAVDNRAAPVIVGSRDTPGNANDVRVVGNLAYVADGASGLQILDVTSPAAPVIVGAVDTPGNAQDVVLRGTLAYVADGANGLQIIDVSDPAAPRIVGTVDTAGTAKGVDVVSERNLAVVADGTTGIRLVDVGNPAAPALLGGIDTGEARDVVAIGDFAYVADFQTSFTVVSTANTAAPAVLGRVAQSLGGLLNDVEVANNFAFGADVFFVNGVPIIDVSAPAPVARAILSFASFRDDNGTGIAVDGSHVYLTAATSITENGTSGTTRLYIGQYVELEDLQGQAPTVRITSPAAGTTVIEGTPLPIAVEAFDDIAVSGVQFLVDGLAVFTDTSAPYQFTLNTPAGSGTVTLGARATDLGGNTGTADPVVLNIIPDPLTTATGRVIDENGSPMAGASVTATGGYTGITLSDGTFSIPGIPTVRGPIALSAEIEVNGELLSGRAQPRAPVPGGTTAFGDLVVRSFAVVGYYDLTLNRGATPQVLPITVNGFEAVDVGDLRTADLSQFDILFVQNPDNSFYSSIFTSNLAKVHAWIQAGGVLVFHDRQVTSAASVLPGSPGSIFRDFNDDANIQIVDSTTRVTNGPGGVVSNTTLDGGNSSSHGYIVAGSVPPGAQGVLSRTAASELVLYSYPFGQGAVVYSTIPLDFYLAGSGAATLNTNMRIYAANVLAWANDLR